MIRHLVPFVSAHPWQSTQAFLQTPNTVLDRNTGQELEHPSDAIRMDHTGRIGADRLLHHAGG